MKKTKEELLEAVRTHGGDTPDDFTIAMLEDIADSFDAPAVEDKTAEVEALTKANADLTAAQASLQEAYDALKKSYADRFTLKEEEKETEDKKEEEAEPEVDEDDTFDSIFED